MWKNLKSLFRIRPVSNDKIIFNKKETDYDISVEFYYSNLINSLILFTMTTKELDKLDGPLFNAMTELESEIDYAFTPVCFDTIFRNELIDTSHKSELLSFKNWTDNIPSEIWDWEFIDNHETWYKTRHKANVLLNKLNVKSRTYNDNFRTI